MTQSEKDVQVLEALVKDGREAITLTLSNDEDVKKVSKLIKLHAGLVSVAEATLQTFKEWKDSHEEEVRVCARMFLNHQAEAIKPRMIECGMEVPK